MKKAIYHLLFWYYYLYAKIKISINKRNKKKRLAKAISEADYKHETTSRQYYVLPMGNSFHVFGKDERKALNRKFKAMGKKQFSDYEFSQLAVYKTKESHI